MAGNARFELASASPDSSFAGNYSQRGCYSGPSLDRSGSLREVCDGRMSNSGKDTVRGRGAPTGTGDIPLLSQCLTFEPIVMGDQRYTRFGELRRVLGYSVGNTTGDSYFGATSLMNSHSVAAEELKHFRASVSDTHVKASVRAKKLDEHLYKLNKYCEAMNPTKKQQRSELSTNERSVGSNLKVGNQIHRIPSNLVNQKPEDRPTNVIRNKRVRTSVAETRSEIRCNGIPRQPLMTSKDREVSNADSDITEEKIRRLPAGGESWDKKMKRKRSVGTVCSRPIDSDGEPKRSMHHKISNEPSLPSSDSQSFRSRANSVAAGVSKLDGTSSLTGSSARANLKIEPDKSTFSREPAIGLNKERLLAKGNMKLSNREDNHVTYPSPITKGKASRAPRSGSIMASNSVSNVHRVPGTLESWELPQSISKNLSVIGSNSRKRAMPSGSSSPPITKWVGQRPQKISRTRRANLVSPVSNHDEIQTPSEGCSPSDFGSRLTSCGGNSSLLLKGSACVTMAPKVKHETISSPARYSESEEYGASENRLKEKRGVGNGEVEEKAVNAFQSVGNSTIFEKKNKFFVKEEDGDGMQRQGRSGRGSSVSRTSTSPVREKLDNATIAKPIRTMRPGSDKNGSKSGRPLKKLLERKGFSRVGHAVTGGSPDFTGESDDDREDLVAAANLAYNSCVLACSSAFWKKMEALFASISSEGKSYLSQQLKSAEELHDSLSQTFGHGNNLQGGCMHEEISLSDTQKERSRSTQNKSESKDLASIVESVGHFKGSMVSRAVDSERGFEHVTPLYQRVLSALIIEDDIEEFDENGWGRCMSNQNDLVDSPDETCCLVDVEGKNTGRMEFEWESIYGGQAQSNGSVNTFLSYHANGAYGRKSSVQVSPWNGELLRRENGYVHSEVQLLVGLSSRGVDGAEGHGNSSIDCQYEKLSLEEKLLLELQSIGLYPETVPDLHDKEDEAMNQEIIQLNTVLYQQVGKKKTCLDNIYEAIQGGKDAAGQDLEQVAMNKLVEMAYKKLLATRGSLASKIGVAKVSKQIALGFARRTVARCKKFENSGASCFNEPGLRDIIFAPPPRVNEAEPLTGAGLATANHSRSNANRGDSFDTFSHQPGQAFATNGPMLSRGKKKEVLLDDVGSAAIRTTSLAGTLLGGAKGKRSERDGNRDASIRSGIAKVGHSSLVDRKTKMKPKQKTTKLSTSGSGFLNKFTETSNALYPSADGFGESLNDSGNRKREVGMILPANCPPDSSKEMKESVDFSKLPLNEIDSIDEIGAGSDIGGPQDFNSWFNFDVDGLQDHDSVGLEIPMDDLSELNMF